MLCNAHYNVGKKILELGNFNLKEDEKTAFYSGIVYADIGRFKLDKIAGVESDSEKFIEELKKHVNTKFDHWFLLGAKIHVFTDKKTKKILKNIFKTHTFGYISYLKRCSILEHYFLKETGAYVYSEDLEFFNLNSILFGIDFLKVNKLFKTTKENLENKFKEALKEFYSSINKINLELPLNLLKITYKKFNTFVTEVELKQQVASLTGASALLSIFATFNSKNLDKKTYLNIKKETEKLYKKGAKFLKRKIYF